MKKLLYTAIIASILTGATVGARAAEQDPAGANKPAEPAKKTGGMPFRGKISAVDKDARTVALASKEKARVFQLTDGTKIKKDGKPATLADVVVGESVGGYAVRNGGPYPEVVTLNLGKGAKPADTADAAK